MISLLLLLQYQVDTFFQLDYRVKCCREDWRTHQGTSVLPSPIRKPQTKRRRDKQVWADRHLCCAALMPRIFWHCHNSDYCKCGCGDMVTLRRVRSSQVTSLECDRVPIKFVTVTEVAGVTAAPLPAALSTLTAVISHIARATTHISQNKYQTARGELGSFWTSEMTF